MSASTTNTHHTLTPFRKRTITAVDVAADLAELTRRRRSVRENEEHAGIDPLLREQVMFAVAMVNECAFCSFMHDDAAVTAGADRNGLARLVGMDPESATDDHLVAVLWAQSRAANGLSSASTALEHAIAQSYTPAQMGGFDTAVRVITLKNLSGNTAEALVRRLRGHPVSQSRIRDEAVVGGGYILGAAASVAAAAIRRRVSPATVWREFRNWSLLSGLN